MKDKIIIDSPNAYGSMDRIGFSLVSSPHEGRRMIRSTFDTCRDYTNDTIIAYVNREKSKKSLFWRAGQPPVDLEKLRMAMMRNPNSDIKIETIKERMYAAKRIINMYEYLGNWEEKSVLTKAEHSCKNIKHCWLLTGPGKWMVSSHLVSMVTLIFRVVSYNTGFEELDTLEKVEEKFKELSIKNISADTSTYLRNSYPKFRMLMKWYDEIFTKKGIEFWNPVEKVCSWHGSGGINALCTFNTYFTPIDDFMRGMWEKWKKEEQEATG